MIIIRGFHQLKILSKPCKQLLSMKSHQNFKICAQRIYCTLKVRGQKINLPMTYLYFSVNKKITIVIDIQIFTHLILGGFFDKFSLWYLLVLVHHLQQTYHASKIHQIAACSRPWLTICRPQPYEKIKCENNSVKIKSFTSFFR